MGDAVAEARPEPGEQRVTRRVAEAVVVRLEAVEVEEQQQVRIGRRRDLEHLFEIAHQRTPVAEAGERIGHRLLARRREHP